MRVGAVILAPGYQVYRAELSEEYGLGRYPNVITALQFERLLSASGPTLGHVQRPSDGRTPERIAFLQCVGSRDQSHDYCSAVCCMYATKEAIMAKEHEPGLDVHVFMMDMRAFSKGYWGYFERARDRYGVHYTRCRLSALREDPASDDLLLLLLGRAARCTRSASTWLCSRWAWRSASRCATWATGWGSSWTSTASATPLCSTRWRPAARYLRRRAIPRAEGHPRSGDRASGAAARQRPGWRGPLLADGDAGVPAGARRARRGPRIGSSSVTAARTSAAI